MIISNTQKYIFLKNKKVGSSSVEIFLSKHLDSKIDVWYGEKGFRGEPDFLSMNVIGNNLDPHISWSEIQEIYRPPDFKTYIVERNPYDQYRSMYEYQKAQRHKPYSPKRFFQFNYGIYLPAGPKVKVLRYENLTEELKMMCEAHEIPFDESLWKKMNFKSSVSKITTDCFYKNYPELKRQVQKEAYHHFNNLGYEK